MFASRTGWALAPNRFSAALERHRAAGREVLDLAESNPTRCGFTYDPALLSLLSVQGGLSYSPHPLGLRSARDSVCSYYRQLGATVVPEQVLLTAGTSEGYSFLFRLLCDPGAEVLVPAPSYPLFEFLASIQDVRLASYPLFYDHGWYFDLHALEAAIGPSTRALLVVHPNNPTGSFVQSREMEALGELCEARGLALVADEVFLDYVHNGPARASFASTRRGLTFTLSGVSKICALPQMKLAWIVTRGAPELTRQALARLEVIADTYLSVSTPGQLALPGFLDGREKIQTQVRDRITANLAELDQQLAAQKLIRRLEIEGGWYAVLRVPILRPDEDLVIALLEQHSVLVHPGHFYDFPGDGYLVVSLITPADAFAEGIRRVLTNL